MTDIEPKEVFRQIGIDLINEYRVRGGFKPIDWLAVNTPEASAFIRSIQLHEKTKKELQGVKQELADFKQKVSDTVEAYLNPNNRIYSLTLHDFIIPAPKPDPLVKVLDKMLRRRLLDPLPDVLIDEAHWLRDQLDALGFEISEKEQGT